MFGAAMRGSVLCCRVRSVLVRPGAAMCGEVRYGMDTLQDKLTQKDIDALWARIVRVILSWPCPKCGKTGICECTYGQETKSTGESS